MGAECLDLAHLAGHVTETLCAFWSLSGPSVVLTIVASCQVSAEQVPFLTQDTYPTMSRVGPGQQELEQPLSGSLGSLEVILDERTPRWGFDGKGHRIPCPQLGSLQTRPGSR